MIHSYTSLYNISMGMIYSFILLAIVAKQHGIGRFELPVKCPIANAQVACTAGRCS